MVKINSRLLPVKAHFFFFFAALGPILPQLNVFGKQLGVSPAAMGAVTGALPLFWMLAKPSFGYVADYFVKQRKLIFMGLIVLMTGSYCCLWFLNDTSMQKFNGDSGFAYLTSFENLRSNLKLNYISNDYKFYNNTCHWANKDNSLKSSDFGAYLYAENVNLPIPIFFFYNASELGRRTCENYTMVDYKDSDIKNELSLNSDVYKYALNVSETCKINPNFRDLICGVKSEDQTLRMEGSSGWSFEDLTLYGSAIFWGFVVLNCVGTVSFNVANCIGDAICFDVLGPSNSEKYGNQRAWGTLGYGITALLSGWLVDMYSSHPTHKDFTPAFVLAAAFTLFDLMSCRKLKLPKLSSDDTLGAMMIVLKTPKMIVFICFAIIVGMLDSFIIYYNFWFLEEIAKAQNAVGSIKLLEGLTTAAQSFGGEILFFFLSGRIITKLGYANTLSLCLVCYSIRLFLLSLITSPWHVLPIEIIMQGPTYALCYACIVGYAAEVAPTGLSATMQGLVAGMDDGLGFTVGSLVGGVLYSCVGGAQAHRVMGVIAALAAIIHMALHYFTGLSRKFSDDDQKKNRSEVEPETIAMLDTVYKSTTMSR